MELLKLSAPHGTAWELLAVALVILIGPVVAERLRLPGMIGLLAGGCLIGPHVFGVSNGVDGILSELGEVGLLYLMFMAGVELDLLVFKRYQRQAVVFALVTFAVPMGLGYLGGTLLGYSPAAAALLGSLFASHTLVVYPAIRRLGLSSNPAVATAVGATVLTDTLALVVLAVVSGSAAGEASGGELVLQVMLGLAVVVGWAFVVLPRLARLFFTTIGQARTARYMFILGALLSAAVVAECVGIESIVGAFFAGLALNRFVPNDSVFMERIEFFGSALFIPIFLVSVGTVIEPAVMVDPATLGLAAVFSACCVGGKLIAAVATRPMFRFTWNEVGVVFSLSVAQAAATLAATFVGLEIGLLSISAVNAVMILIVVSLLVASLAANRFGRGVPAPPVDAGRLGRSVLLHVDPDADLRALALVAARIAGPDGGVVRPAVIVTHEDPLPTKERQEEITAEIAALGVDVEVEVRYDRSATEGLIHLAAEGASLIVTASPGEAWLPTLLGAPQHQLVAQCTVPVVAVRTGRVSPQRVVLALGSAHAQRPGTAALAAAEVSARLGRTGWPVVVVAADEPDHRLTEAVGGGVVTESPLAWITAHAGPTDIVVIPGGRNGAIAAARASKRAAGAGCTVLIVADRAAVAPGDATLGLGLTGGRDATEPVAS